MSSCCEINCLSKIKRGKTHNKLILKTILQKNAVLKLMSYTASSLVETSSSQKLFRGIFFSVSWHLDVAVNCLLELVSCRDELQAYFLISLVLARTLLLKLW